MRPPQILVVDDEPSITTALSGILGQVGYQVAIAHSGAETLARLQEPFDLLILDLMLPDIDGYAICRQARELVSYLPILMLTARDAQWEKVMGLELGADAYMTKPFEPGELVAQVKAILRLVTQTNGTLTGQPLTCGSLSLWVDQRRVEVEGMTVELTAKEFDLLRFLMQQPGRAFGRQTLLRQVWDYTFPDDSRTVDVHIQRLRAKIEPDPTQPELIRTIRGFGYCLTMSD